MTDEAIIRALEKLDALAQAEYGTTAVDVVEDPARLRRLTGIMLKEPFATAHPIGSGPTMTGARRYWKWDIDRLTKPADPSSPEYEMLDELRKHFDLGRGDDGLRTLVEQAEHERGLFKILAQWLNDKLRGRESKSVREYYLAKESTKADALLDLADYLANFALTPVYVALLPAGGFVVPLLLLVAKHGYKAMSEQPDEADERN